MMKPTFNQLISFCTVAEVGNIGRAAERLSISQPPLSRQIAQLESNVGAKLFTRDAKGVRLTIAGEQFLTDAHAILALMQQACNNVRAVADGQQGFLKLAATMYASYSVVPQVAMRHKASYPDVKLLFKELVPTDLISALQDGSIDAAISFGEPTTSDINSLVILQEPLIAALPANHHFADNEALNLACLGDDQFITVPRAMAPMLYDTILSQCQKAGFSPHIGLEVSSQQTIVNFVANGFGVALIPASMQHAQIRGVVYKELAGANTVQNVLMWNARNENPSLKRFLSLCREIRDELNTAQAGE